MSNKQDRHCFGAFKFPPPTKLSATILFLAFLGCFPNRSVADVVWLKDGRTVYGRIIEQSDTIRFRPTDKNGTLGKIETVPANEVIAVRINIDPSRLKQLSVQSGSARKYIEYAEELAAEHRDPVARSMAWRLFLLAAAHGTVTETQSALLGLAGLERAAGTADADLRIEILLLLHSEQNGPSTTGDRTSKAGRLLLTNGSQETQVPDATELRTMLKLVRSIRQDRTQAAINLLNQPTNKTVWPKWEQQVSAAELSTMARKGKLSPIDLRRLLSIELSIERQLASRRSTEGEFLAEPVSDKKTWAEQAYQAAADAIVLPSLETFAEEAKVNLRATMYLDGQWRLPERTNKTQK